MLNVKTLNGKKTDTRNTWRQKEETDTRNKIRDNPCPRFGTSHSGAEKRWYLCIVNPDDNVFNPIINLLKTYNYGN